MPTLEELLKDKDPEALKKLLSSNSSSIDDSDTESKDDMSDPDHPIHELMRNANSERKQRQEKNNPENLQKLLSQLKSSEQTPVTTPPIYNPEDIQKNVDFVKAHPFTTLPQSAHLPVGELVPASTRPSPNAPSPAQMATSAPTSETEEPEEESDPSAVAGLFSKRAPAEQPVTPPVAPPMATGFSQNTVQNLKDVQDKANDEKLKNQTFKNLNLFASGLAGGNAAGLKPNNEPFDEADKMEDEKVAQFKEQLAKEGDDPESDISKKASVFAAEVLGKAGLSKDLVKGMSYNQIEKNFPQISKMMDVKMAADARKEASIQRSLDRQALMDQKQESKLSENDTKRLDTVNKLITPGLASSRSPLGKDVSSLYAVQNAKALLEGADLDSIDNRQIAEVARILDRVLSGGSPTISGTEHLTPETAKMKLSKMMEQVSNKRQGAGASDFLKNNLETFDREEKLAKQRIQNTAQEALGSYLDIAKRNPSAWDSQMAQHNLLDVMGTEALKKQAAAGSKNRADYEKHSNILAPGQEIVQMNGKNYIVDHNTKKVIGEAP